MVSSNLGFFLALLFLLSYVKDAMSVGVGNNVTVKMARCRDNERRALLDFKEGLLWYGEIVSSWGKGKEEDCCHWRGIRCSKRTGHVTVLSIPGYDFFSKGISYNSSYNFSNNAWGKVSPSLLELSHLKYLDLSYNHFDSNIPEFFGSLTRLEYLNLSHAFYLDLSGNLTNLHFLRYLDLSGIDLNKSSDWLQQIFKLPFLRELHLSGCHLTLPEYPLLPITNSSSSLFPLAVVDLSFNDFIYPSAYNWLFNFSSSLVQIDLSHNYLNGSIPEALGSMVSLENLSLKHNNFIGHLPESFWNLSRLDTLDLEYNGFDGKLNEFLHPLAANQKNSLRVLRLGENQLCGSLPDFTSFPYLREISVYKNKLNGSLPEKISQVADLVHLDVSSNQITGILPNLTLLSSLEVLRLHNNQLEDTISEAYFSNLTKLHYLDLSSNRLTLKFSFEWVPPFQLNNILLRNCYLGPRFPNWLHSQQNIYMLDISGVGISDTIPLWFWDIMPRLDFLNISNNQIQGTLPDLSHKLDYIFGFDMSSNNLKGLIPSFPHEVWVLRLSRNKFTGLASFLCKTAYTRLFFLDLSENQLSGKLPDCWMNMHLEYLNLANNNFSGKLPTSIGLLNPIIMQLRNNSFTGEFPSSLKNYSRTLVLDLSRNELSGVLPTWIGTDLTSLVVFSVRKNKFSGSIPSQVCHLRNAQVLDLSQNKISGSIPLCFNNLTSLITRENSVVSGGTTYGGTSSNSEEGSFIFIVEETTNAFLQWKGVESEYKSTLGLLKMIDLSSNKLVGTIPNEFSYLEGLISLNLSRNKLYGNIIQNISQMKNLEVLDLSQNLLTGEIPSGLASLTFLSVLNLSNNNLLGKIPPGTQLQSFDASAYAGNDKLCGRPLSSVCPGEETSVLPPTPVGHGSDKHNEVGLYVSVVFGFATGFWGLIGPILLRRTWRHAYFRLLQKIYDWIYLTAAVNMARLQRKIQG